MFKSIVAVSALMSFTLGNVYASSGPTSKTYGDAWIETIGEYPVVHLKGDEHQMGVQMGVQMGALAGDILNNNINDLRFMAEKNIGDFVKYVPNSIFKGLRHVIGWVFWLTYSKDIKTNIKGIVEGARNRPDHIVLNRFDLAFMNALIDITGLLNSIGDKLHHSPSKFELIRALGFPAIHANCDTMAVWGPRTVGGKTFQTRNTDIDTGKGIEKYPLIMVIKKDDKIPVISTSIAGLVGVFSGMNAYGVGLGQVWARSIEGKLHTPWQLQIREVFMNAKTAKEAVTLFSKMHNTVYGNNFVFADAGDGEGGSTSEAYAIETTAKQFSVFSPNDPRELLLKFNGETLGLPIPYGIARGDVAFDLNIRAKQTASNGPNGDPRGSGGYKERYKGQIDRILAYEQQGILMGGNEAIAISKETAMRDANLTNTVYANTDRELWVSYAKMDPNGGPSIQAYEREYTNIPFYEYLPTLKRDRTGAVSIHSYLDSKKSPRSFAVEVSNAGKSIARDTVENINQESYPLPSLRGLRHGDLVELRDLKDNRLIDRLAI